MFITRKLCCDFSDNVSVFGAGARERRPIVVRIRKVEYYVIGTTLQADWNIFPCTDTK